MVLRLSLDKLNNEFVMNEIRYKKNKGNTFIFSRSIKLVTPWFHLPVNHKMYTFFLFQDKKVVCYIFSIRWLQIKVQ